MPYQEYLNPDIIKKFWSDGAFHVLSFDQEFHKPQKATSLLSEVAPD